MKPLAARRHRDDNYWDEIKVDAEGDSATLHPLHWGASLHIHLMPRFKTSGLSGDEWRVSAYFVLRCRDRLGIGAPVFDRNFHSVNDALKYGPHFIWTEGQKLLFCPNAIVTIKRKGRTLWTEEFPTFGDAAIGLNWHIVMANEQDDAWKHLSNEEERAHCCQPGCSEAPTRLYRLKKHLDGHSMIDFDDWQPRHRWFCERHAHRGDAGREDCDDNYEAVEGPPPNEAAVNPHDVSRSKFGGIL